MFAHVVNDLSGILLVLSGVAALMGGLAAYQRRCRPHPERVRKLMHVGSGCLALPFPWLFHGLDSVVVVASVGLLGMLAVRRLPLLNRACGSVLGGVERRSLGDLYFPVAIGFVFAMAEGDPVLYTVPILVLTLADTAAALVGICYGCLRFRTPGGLKSVEGCAAFFAVALLCTALPAAAWTSLEPARVLLVAALVAGLLTAVEAVSFAGSDNLTVPAAAYGLLQLALPLGPNALAVPILAMAAAAGALVLHLTAVVPYCDSRLPARTPQR